MRCLGCGYSINDVSRQQCPECGRRFNTTDASTFEREPWGSERLHRVMSRVMSTCWICAACGAAASILRIIMGIMRVARANAGPVWEFYAGVATGLALLGVVVTIALLAGLHENLSRVNGWMRYRGSLRIIAAIWAVFLATLALV